MGLNDDIREIALDAARASTDDDFGEEYPEPDLAVVGALADAVFARLKKLLPAGFFSSPDQRPRVQPPDSQWLTAAEAARYLGMKKKALYSAVERGQVPTSRLGRRLRFNRVGLDRLLERRTARMGARVPSPGKDSERW